MMPDTTPERNARSPLSARITTAAPTAAERTALLAPYRATDDDRARTKLRVVRQDVATAREIAEERPATPAASDLHVGRMRGALARMAAHLEWALDQLAEETAARVEAERRLASVVDDAEEAVRSVEEWLDGTPKALCRGCWGLYECGAHGPDRCPSCAADRERVVGALELVLDERRERARAARVAAKGGA